MPQRLRLLDFRTSDGPEAIGLCQSDLPGCAKAVNAAQRRLLYAKESGDEGWHGTWAEMVFNVNTTDYYFTVPRGVARVQRVLACNEAIPVQNQFYEFLDFNIGYQSLRLCQHQQAGLYTRNNVCLFTDLTSAPQTIIAYASDQRDIDGGKRVLIQGEDQNGNTVYTQDGAVQVTGEFLTLESPFTATALPMNSVTGVQKDVTYGPVTISQLDPSTGAQITLLVMEPGETTAWYRRYYLGDAFRGCCSLNNQVRCIVKLDLVPAVVDTDYLLIQNLEALIHECQSIRASQMDNPQSISKARFHHSEAIRLLVGELTHFHGKDSPAVNIQPFGSAKLERLHISMR